MTACLRDGGLRGIDRRTATSGAPRPTSVGLALTLLTAAIVIAATCDAKRPGDVASDPTLPGTRGSFALDAELSGAAVLAWTGGGRLFSPAHWRARERGADTAATAQDCGQGAGTTTYLTRLQRDRRSEYGHVDVRYGCEDRDLDARYASARRGR